MNYEKFTVSTITFGRNAEEERRMIRGLNTLSAKNIPTIIAADGGSSKEFLKQIINTPNLQIIKSSEKSLQSQVRESLKKAAQAKQPYVFYTESDKFRFFENALDEFIEKATEIAEHDPNFGLIIPERNPESFANFPKFQQYTESAINELITRLTDQDQKKDYLYGPKIVAKSLISYLDKIPEDIGWGWMSYLAVIAHKLSKKNYIIPLNLPTSVENEMEDEAERMLRLRQMKDHINGIYFASTLQL